jgi:hypothetical protein
LGCGLVRGSWDKKDQWLVWRGNGMATA